MGQQVEVVAGPAPHDIHGQAQRIHREVVDEGRLRQRVPGHAREGERGRRRVGPAGGTAAGRGTERGGIDGGERRHVPEAGLAARARRRRTQPGGFAGIPVPDVDARLGAEVHHRPGEPAGWPVADPRYRHTPRADVVRGGGMRAHAARTDHGDGIRCGRCSCPGEILAEGGVVRAAPSGIGCQPAHEMLPLAAVAVVGTGQAFGGVAAGEGSGIGLPGPPDSRHMGMDRPLAQDRAFGGDPLVRAGRLLEVPEGKPQGEPGVGPCQFPVPLAAGRPLAARRKRDQPDHQHHHQGPERHGHHQRHPGRTGSGPGRADGRVGGRGGHGLDRTGNDDGARATGRPRRPLTIPGSARIATTACSIRSPARQTAHPATRAAPCEGVRLSRSALPGRVRPPHNTRS